ncbi:hypothetical protein ACA910_005247 [Epithemia clementina (nom. ined.)]
MGSPKMLNFAVMALTSLLTLSESSIATATANNFVPSSVRSLSNYGYMHFDRCLRIKIVENNDDDGNSYFYNGAYRSQSMLYLAYRLCSDCKCSDGGTSFVMPAADVLQEQITYTQGYCESCSNKCRRRRVEEDGEEEQQQVEYDADCNTCVDQCSPLLLNYFEGNDETEYLDCQAAHDEDGVQYYSGPACDSSGLLTIGLYYDEECTVKKDEKSGGYGENFSRNTFFSMEEMCIPCESSGLCDDMEQGLQCVEGKNVNENVDDDMKVCKTYKKVTKEWIYASPKRTYPVALCVMVMILASLFCFGSYTYYVRHKRAAAEKALNETTVSEQTLAAKADYAKLT